MKLDEHKKCYFVALHPVSKRFISKPFRNTNDMQYWILTFSGLLLPFLRGLLLK